LEFLRAHYEKLILGVCLLGLLISCYCLLRGLKLAGADVKAVQEKADTAVERGLKLEPLKAREFNAEGALHSPKIKLEAAAVDGISGLVNPYKYIRCSTPDCDYLLLYEFETCPYCEKDLPKPSGEIEKDKEDTGKHDFDEDGMPNFYESQYPFLDPNVADGNDDYDGDLFTNVEEFRAKTDPADPRSFPPLATNLRFIKIYRKQIPILLKKLTRQDPEDKKTWVITCLVQDRGRTRPRTIRVGDKVAGFEIADVRYKVIEDTKRRRVIDASELDVKKGENEAYTLIMNRPGWEKDWIAHLMYLTTRLQQYWKRCPQLHRKLDDVLELPHRSKKKEAYKITRIDAKTLVVTEVKPAGDEADAISFPIAKVNPKADFFKRTSRSRFRRPTFPGAGAVPR